MVLNSVISLMGGDERLFILFYFIFIFISFSSFFFFGGGGILSLGQGMCIYTYVSSVSRGAINKVLHQMTTECTQSCS